MLAKGRRRGILTTCDYCKEIIYVSPYQLKKFKFHFCNVECRKNAYKTDEEIRKNFVECCFGRHWAKGLTKETDPRVAKCGNRTSGG
jgi:hypothetical protein